ncbi:hypothetical protein GLOTRDRAFT_127481 [Gloeophyllum trabeum ATCC 11539]|uniref:BZIP domain-containing protein n=1 Tax=Gloeophyllum trabeum (strain ATCC 11539 / FP-39264 / Madison 617) TaxID=670483 RepID=S7RV54_GLOTA|nr:uncharacterized protein GLOTRDRAFT_127481 [Gloeophyllum trabeum ATCC 11539]EPQ57104.1 hypothetical protein GLOTRDRAFT_127481 [Gloeophyllum trabeum ATCC 11539]
MNVSNPSVDPMSLSLPSPSDSTSGKRSSSPDSNVEGPSRKRQRSDATSEERREARMHRNRIAAQNSRDRRKAQFSYLERRVAELEEENRQLRASLGTQGFIRAQDTGSLGQEKERARDRENEELKERIKTLERGWEAVVKALAAQGLPTGLSSASLPPASTLEPSIRPLPVAVPPNFPLSPAPSHSSSSALPSPGPLYPDGSDFTRHSARLNGVLATAGPSLPTNTTTSTIDEAAMDTLLREILAEPPSTSLNSSPSPLQLQVSPSYSPTSPVPITSTITPPTDAVANVSDWEPDMEMQRLLDLLPSVQPDGEEFISSSLDLDLCGWDMDSVVHPTSSNQLGVF